MKNFRPKKRDKPSLLYRNRPSNNLELVCFKSNTQNIEAYFHENTLEYMLQEMEEARPNETIGLLAGRPFKDNKGLYTLIQAAEVAKSNEIDQSPGQVKISGKGREIVRARLEQNYPMLELVGWFHTHPTSSVFYSYEDKEEQKTWPNEYHIGVVVSGTQKEEPFGVFSGPDAIPLTRSIQTSLPSFQPQLQKVDVVASLPSQSIQPAPKPEKPPLVNHTQPKSNKSSFLVIVSMSMLALTIISYLFWWMSMRINSIEGDTKTQISTLESKLVSTPTSTPIVHVELPDARIKSPPPPNDVTEVRLREYPDTKYEILGSYPIQTPLQIIGQEATGNWTKVETPDGKIGWVYNLYLDFNIDLSNVPMDDSVFPLEPIPTPTLEPTSTSTLEPTSTPTPNTPQWNGIIVYSALNLREGPSIQYNSLGYYQNQTHVIILGKSLTEQWVKVQLPDNKVGWMSANPQYLKINVDLSTIPVVE